MEYMFQPGFLGTRAPFFMDFVTVVVTLLPLAVGMAIGFAKRQNYSLHRVIQISVFIISVVVVGYFEYGVRLAGGYEVLSKESHVAHNYLLIVLGIHIVISVITLGFWMSTLISAQKSYKRGGVLPGVESSVHQKAGLRTFMGIVLTSLTGIWIYLLLFVF